MILETMIRQKRYFNEKSKKDIAVAKTFFANHGWGKSGCPFILEYPYMTVPDMIKDKMIYKSLGIKYDRERHWIVK